MAFGNIIGYKDVKEEFSFLKTALLHRKELSKRSVDIPSSFLLHGPCGTGKKFMVSEFVRDLGCDSFTFTSEEKYETRLENFTAWLDKTDKDDNLHIICIHNLDRIAEMDGEKGTVMLRSFLDRDLNGTNIFVIATAYSAKEDLPDWCCHDHLFERNLFVGIPELPDMREICNHLIKKKSLSITCDPEDIVKAITGHTYATAENILNNAVLWSLKSGMEQDPCVISREVFVKAVGEPDYGVGESIQNGSEELFKVAIHEAGHILAGEVIQPGCIGFASINPSTRSNCRGYVTRCLFTSSDTDIDADRIMRAAYHLSGIAAVEHRLGTKEPGASDDIDKAQNALRYGVTWDGTSGLSLVTIGNLKYQSPVKTERQENAIDSLMEEAYEKALQIMKENTETLGALAGALFERKYIFNSEINEILKRHPLKK